MDSSYHETKRMDIQREFSTKELKRSLHHQYAFNINQHDKECD